MSSSKNTLKEKSAELNDIFDTIILMVAKMKSMLKVSLKSLDDDVLKEEAKILDIINLLWNPTYTFTLAIEKLWKNTFFDDLRSVSNGITRNNETYTLKSATYPSKKSNISDKILETDCFDIKTNGCITFDNLEKPLTLSSKEIDNDNNNISGTMTNHEHGKHEFADKYLFPEKKGFPERHKFSVNDVFECAVVSVESPSSFYVFPKLYFDAYNENASDMCKTYDNSDCCFKTKNELKSLKYFAINIDEGDLGWCRAILSDLLMDIEDKVQMYCIDIGRNFIVHINSVYPPAPIYFNHPPMAYHCGMYQVKPVSTLNEWSKEAIDYFKGLVFEIGSVFVANVTQDFLKVHLVVSGRELTMDLVLKKLGTLIIEKNEIEETDNNCDLLDDLAADNEKFTECKTAIEGGNINDEILVCKNYKGPPAKYCYKGAKCKKSHVALIPDGWTVAETPTANIPYSTLPPVDSILTVKITSVLNYKDFYLQIISSEKVSKVYDLKKFCQAHVIQSYLNKKSTIKSYQPLAEFPSKAEFVIALHPEHNKWLRAQVVDTHHKCAKIFFVDYGYFSTVNYGKMRKLTDEFVWYPKQAIQCNLFNVNKATSCENENEAHKFFSSFMNKKLTAVVKYVEDSNQLLLISLRDDKNSDIGELMLSRGLVIPHKPDVDLKKDQLSDQANKLKLFPG